MVVSGLALNFVPDQRAALAEMARVTGKGGMIAGYVWDYAGKMELMRYFWDAAIELDPSAAKMDEGIRFPLCRQEALENLFAEAGLEGVEVKPIDIPMRFTSLDDYSMGGSWQPPAAAIVSSNIRPNPGVSRLPENQVMILPLGRSAAS